MTRGAPCPPHVADTPDECGGCGMEQAMQTIHKDTHTMCRTRITELVQVRGTGSIRRLQPPVLPPFPARLSSSSESLIPHPTSFLGRPSPRAGSPAPLSRCRAVCMQKTDREADVQQFLALTAHQRATTTATGRTKRTGTQLVLHHRKPLRDPLNETHGGQPHLSGKCSTT